MRERRGPRGPCGLKWAILEGRKTVTSRGPRGPCGLKFTGHHLRECLEWSRPARALWIEIVGFTILVMAALVEAREGLVD